MADLKTLYAKHANQQDRAFKKQLRETPPSDEEAYLLQVFTDRAIADFNAVGAHLAPAPTKGTKKRAE